MGSIMNDILCKLSKCVVSVVFPLLILLSGCAEVVRPAVLASEVDDAFTQVRTDARHAGDTPAGQIRAGAVVDSAAELKKGVSLTLFNEPLSDVLPLIISDIEWGNGVDTRAKVSINVENASVEEALTMVLRPVGLLYLKKTHGIRVEKQKQITFRAFKQPLHIVLSTMLGSIDIPYIIRDGAGEHLEDLLNAQFERVPLESALDRLLAPIGLFWKRDNRTYVIYRDQERMFDINFPLLEQAFEIRSTREARAPKSQTTTTSAGLSREGTRFDVEGGVSASTSLAMAYGESASMKNISDTLEGFLTDNGKLVIHPEVGSIWVRDRADVVDRIGEFLDRINRKLRRSVRIRGVITEIDLDDGKQFGVDWRNVAQNVAGAMTIGQNLGQGVTLNSLGVAEGVLNRDNAFTNVSTQSNILTLNTRSTSGSEVFNLFIRALRSYGDVRVVSRPSLVVNNGAVGSLLVGETVSYVAQAYTSTTSSASITNSIIVQPLQTGLGFYVLPHIVSEEEAILYVSPELTTLQTLRNIQNGNNTVEAPHISMKQTQTVVSIKNGESLILGGLMSERESDERAVVPIIGDIPILGSLFRNIKKERRITEFALLLEVAW